MESVGTSDLEEISEGLDKVVVLGKDTWSLMLYSAVSPFSPRIKINGVPTRGNLHTLLVGDVATAKSRVCNIIQMIAPKSDRITKVTEASLEGVAGKGYIEKGLIDASNNGVLIIPEFTTMFQRFKILREVMDADRITIMKAGETKEMDVNITFFAGCNPVKDFFQEGGRLRSQIPFKEGVLSRFDCLIPLLSTCRKNEILLDRINIFGDCEAEVDLLRIRNLLDGMSRKMLRVKEVVLGREQRQRIREVFLRHNKDLDNRPLLLLRDLETISRLVNVIATARGNNGDSANRAASDEDVDRGIELWETLIDLRKSLYTRIDREILSVKEKILQEIIKLGRARTVELERVIVNSQSLCSKATFYRKLNELKVEGRIGQDGLRDGLVCPS